MGERREPSPPIHAALLMEGDHGCWVIMPDVCAGHACTARRETESVTQVSGSTWRRQGGSWHVCSRTAGCVRARESVCVCKSMCVCIQESACTSNVCVCAGVCASECESVCTRVCKSVCVCARVVCVYKRVSVCVCLGRASGWEEQGQERPRGRGGKPAPLSAIFKARSWRLVLFFFRVWGGSSSRHFHIHFRPSSSTSPGEAC